MKMERLDILRICRLCLQSTNDLKDIFGDVSSSYDLNRISLSSKIMACVSVKISNTDRGPHKICTKCLDYVNSWFEFNELCRISDAKLQKYLNECSGANESFCTSTPEKLNIISETSTLPDISILSQDSFFERSVSLGSNLSSIINFCFNSQNRAEKLDGESVDEFNLGAELNLDYTIPIPKENLEGKKKKGYECEFCKCHFSRFSHLLNHDNSKHEVIEKKFSCPVCERLFISASRIEPHRYLSHREKSFKCPICDKQFVSAKSLNVHSRLHSEKYRCQICGFATTSKLYLSQHSQKHLGVDTSFSCGVCEKRFSQRSSLLRHENLHLKSKGRSFRCSICSLFVRSRSELVSHMGVHRELPQKVHLCNICDKRFKSKKIAAAHIKRHYPPKFVCEICDKKWLTAYELRVHKETHSDNKPFECFHCNKRFSFKNTLVRHIRKHYPRIRSDMKI